MRLYVKNWRAKGKKVLNFFYASLYNIKKTKKSASHPPVYPFKSGSEVRRRSL